MRSQLFRSITTTKVDVDNDTYVHTNSVTLPITTEFKIVDTTTSAKWPVFRILDPAGNVLNESLNPQFKREDALKMYRLMVRIQCLDDVFYNAQRQGRISFYMQSSGEEAIHLGSVSLSYALH